MPDMKTELEKRRVLRMSNEESNRLTKECLQTALIYLMSEKPFEKITITELVKRSGVSRTAFYRNYDSKEDILSELNIGFINELASSISDIRYQDNPRLWFLDFFGVTKDNADIFRLLLQSHLSKDTIIGSHCILETIFPSHSSREHYELLALEGAFVAILTNWFRDGMQESPENMADYCMQLLDTRILFHNKEPHKNCRIIL